MICDPGNSRTIWWGEGLWLIDQTKLPSEYKPIKIENIKSLIEAIKSLRIRGAPALGAAGAYGVALAAQLSRASNAEDLLFEVGVAAEMIKASRPTAVNLSWGTDRVMRVAESQDNIEDIRGVVPGRGGEDRRRGYNHK